MIRLLSTVAHALPRLIERSVYGLIVAGVVLGAGRWILDVQPNPPTAAAELSRVQGLLFYSQEGLDLYPIQQSASKFWGNVDVLSEVDIPPEIWAKQYVKTHHYIAIPFESLFQNALTLVGFRSVQDHVQLATEDDVVVQEDDDVRLYRASENQLYDLSANDREHALGTVALTPPRTTLGAIIGDEYVIDMRFLTCNRVQKFILGPIDGTAADQVASRGLPIERDLLHSPLLNYIALADHIAFRRLHIFNVANGTTEEVVVPDFDENQTHHTATFLDNNTLAFNVVDDQRTATVLYDIPSHTSRVLSEAFSDRILADPAGNVVLVQTMFPGDHNVPYGSMAFARERHIPVTMTSHQDGTHVLLRLSLTGAELEREEHAFSQIADEGFVPYDRDVRPLLEMAGIPRYTIEQIERRTAQLARQGIEYRLLDMR